MSLIIVVLLALAAIAVLAGVAFVVMGKGGELARFEADHPPLDLPADRPLSGSDVSRVLLPLSLWGYHVRAVDDVLRRVVGALSERDARIADLERRLYEAGRPDESSAGTGTAETAAMGTGGTAAGAGEAPGGATPRTGAHARTAESPGGAHEPEQRRAPGRDYADWAPEADSAAEDTDTAADSGGANGAHGTAAEAAGSAPGAERTPAAARTDSAAPASEHLRQPTPDTAPPQPGTP